MATTSSGPEDFLTTMVILLVVMVVVVLLADWVTRSGVLRSRGRGDREKKKRRPKESPPAGVVAEPQDRVSIVRMQRDYYNFGFGGRRRSDGEESGFGQLFSQINASLNDDPTGSSGRELFKQLDELMIRQQCALMDSKDQPVSLHMEHNYLWLKFRQVSQIDPTEAFLLLIQSLGKLMERERLQPYGPGELDWILERYEGTMGQLYQARGINFNRVTVAFFAFSARYNLLIKDGCGPQAREAAGRTLAGMTQLMLERHYLPMVQSHYLAELRVEHIQSIADQVDGLRRRHEAAGLKDARIETMCHYMSCRIKMFQLRTMTTLDPSPGRVQDIHEAHMRMLANESAEEAKDAVQYAGVMLSERDSRPEDRSMLAQAEIVRELAVHFQATYGKRHVLESWTTMESVKRKVVQKVLEERISTSEELLASCDEEWGVLNASTREWLSRQLRKRAQEGAEDPTSPAAGTEGALKALRVLSHIQREGIPPAVYELLMADMVKAKVARGTYSAEVRSLVRSISANRSGTLDPIDLPEGWTGYRLDKGTAVLFRLTPIRRDVEELGGAFGVCARKGIRSVTVCVNLMQDMGSAEFLRKYASAFERKNPRMSITVFDAKDLVTELVSCLRENGVEGDYELTAGLAL